jgi:oligopeptidase B
MHRTLCVLLALVVLRDDAPKPPVAAKVPHVTKLHGEERSDEYFWMRQRESAEVRDHLAAENAYADAMLKPTLPLQETLYQEMLGRIQETDLSVPWPENGFLYYSRTEQGKAYPIHCRKKGTLDAPEEVILDVNELARGEKFMSVGAQTVSDDGNLLAYTTDRTGFRQYTLHVKDLRTGKLGPERIPRVNDVTWAADGKTLFYVVEDPVAKRPYRLHRHALGAAGDDPLVHEEKDERFTIGVRRSRSRAFVILEARSHTSGEARLLPADRPDGDWRVVEPRSTEHEYYVDHRADLLYVRTNSGGRNFRVVTAPLKTPGREHWKELIPHRDDVMVESIDLFAGHLVVRERSDGLPRLAVHDLALGGVHQVAFPEPTYMLFPERNAEFDTTAFRFQYQSLITSPSVFEYDLAKRDRKLLKQTPVLGGYDPARYVSERLHARAPDGTRIPISMVRRKDVARDAGAPMLLVGYGAYGSTFGIAFSGPRLSLLDRGVSWGFAHVRGGGELGKRWHDDGRMLKKRNSFTDFIAAADHLVAEKITARDRLAIQGGSAGGLLMGAVLNLRPDLCKAAVVLVPFVDVLNTMLDESLPLTVGEFEEWGNPKTREHYDYLRTYCPYTNLAAKAYPSILVRTSFHDSQVMYWEPAKWVARLRALKTDRNPLIFKINLAGGHGGSSGRYDRLRENALDTAFVLTQVGAREELR